MKKLTLFFCAALFAFAMAGSAVADRAEPAPAAPEFVQCHALGELISGVPEVGKVCCKGLVQRDIKEDFDEECQSKGAGGYVGTCLACGDGVCDEKFESKCNCAEDCADAGKPE